MVELYMNGKIYTERASFVKAMVVKENRIIFIGSNEEAKDRMNEFNGHVVIDLKGRTVIPGLNDSHLHFMMTAEYLSMLPISDVTSMKELVARGKEYLHDQKLTKEDFLYTEGWNQNHFTDEQRIPNRHDLDQISTEIPIAMGRVDRHIVSLNSAALDFLGITTETLSPEGGEIRKDLNGKPTGVLAERAVDIMREKIPKKSPEELEKMFKKTMYLANSQGLTSVHTCDCKDETLFDTFSFYENLEADLTLRFYHQMWFNDGQYLPSYLASGFRTGQGTPFNKVGPVKLFADGALGGRTAAMREDYVDDPGNRGILTKSQETLNKEVKMAFEHGNQVIIHAIGDKGIEAVLDAYDAVLEEDDTNNLRLGVNHMQITDTKLVERLKKKDYIVYVQPIFLEDDIPIVEERVGKELAKTSYAFGTMEKLGIHQSFSTDAPIASFQPFLNMYCALTRKRLNGKPTEGYVPSEAMDIYSVVDAYTLESAYASFEEAEKGRIKPGFLADFIVLDRDIFTISPEEVKETKVLTTVVDGQIVYQAEKLSKGVKW